MRFVMCLLISLPVATAQVVTSLDVIGHETGGLTAPVNWKHAFGNAVANLGDVDGDGVPDLAVGAPHWNDNTDPDNRLLQAGQVLILLMNADRTVRETIRIRTGHNGFSGPVEAAAWFGERLGALGDLDGDGVPDLAVGAPSQTTDHASLWILFLNDDGTVKAEVRHDPTVVGLAIDEAFGRGLEALGDEDNDGTLDLIVGGMSTVYRLSLNADGSVANSNLLYTDSNPSAFGYSVTNLGDLDGNGFDELVVGGNAVSFDVLFRDSYTSVDRIKRVHDSFTNSDFSGLGIDLVAIPDLDGNGVADLVAGAALTDFFQGSVAIISLGPTGDVNRHTTIRLEGLPNHSYFGSGIAVIPDLAGDGIPDLAVGAHGWPRNAGQVHQIGLSCGIDGDGAIGLTELSIVLAQFGEVGEAFVGDITGDDIVDLADLAIVLRYFGESCW